jgi:hypothetical protein
MQLLLVLASAVILGSESRGTHDDILLSQIRDSSNLEGRHCLHVIVVQHSTAIHENHHMFLTIALCGRNMS